MMGFTITVLIGKKISRAVANPESDFISKRDFAVRNKGELISMGPYMISKEKRKIVISRNLSIGEIFQTLHRRTDGWEVKVPTACIADLDLADLLPTIVEWRVRQN